MTARKATMKTNHELMRELVENPDALQAYLQELRIKYAGYKKAREAMRALFEAEECPLSEDEIKEKIVDRGGFRRGAGGIAGARLVIQKSIKLHLHGDGAKKWPLKKINGLIGPKDWDDRRFEGK